MALVGVSTRAGIAAPPFLETQQTLSFQIRDQLLAAGELPESTIVVPKLDNTGAINPAIAALVPGNIVKARDATGAQTIHSFLIEKRSRDIFDAVDPASCQYGVSGRPLLAVMNEATWLPTRGYDAFPWNAQRTFGFHSLDYSPTRAPGSWQDAHELMRQDANGNLSLWAGGPMRWPDGDSWWIGCPSDTPTSGHVGSWYVVGDFVLAAPTNVIILYAADDKANVYVDGFPVGTGGGIGGWQQMSWVMMFMTAGTHRIAAKVSNGGTASIDPPWGMGAATPGNPTAFICVAYSLGPNGGVNQRLIHTDHLWGVLEYPATPPGMTIGKIMNIGLNEAHFQGVIQDVTGSFTDTHDSRGALWPILESVTVSTQDSYLTTLGRWTQDYCDVGRMGPNDLILDMYLLGTAGDDAGVTFKPSNQNLVHLAEDGVYDNTDILTLLWNGGISRYPKVGGTKQVAVSTGADTLQEATLIGIDWLNKHAGEIVQTTPALRPRDATEMPGQAFWIGDSFDIDEETGGGPIGHRTISVLGTWTDNNGWDFAVALDAKHLTAAESGRRILNWVTPASAGGSAPAQATMMQAMAISGVGFSGFTPPAALDTDLSGWVDGVHTKMKIVPLAAEPFESGIIVKAPSATWGGMAAGGSPDYGKGQFISFHKWGAGMDDSPNNTLLFRVDKTGGIGCTGGMHLATGLRQDVGYSVPQALWIQPTFDMTYVAMTGVAGQTLPFLWATNSVGSMVFEVFPSGAVQSANDIAARVGTAQQVAIGNVSGFPSINFGNDLTTFLARTSTPTYLQVTNHLQAVGELIAEAGQTDKQVVIGTMFGTYAGIGFGTALDALMWRAFPGFISCSDSFHVKNINHATTAVLTLQNAAGQTGKAVRGLNSVGTEIWSIDPNGILSTAGGAFPPSSGNWTMKDSLVVQNSGATGTTVLSAIGVSGQTGYLIAGVQSTGGVVFSVTNGGAVSAASTVTATAINATGGTSFFAAISVSSVASTGGGQFSTLALSGAITGATSIAGTSLNVGSGTVTAGTGTFSNAVSADNFTASTTTSTFKSVQITANGSGTVALAVFGVAGQTANLQSWLNSGGGTVASLTNAGAFTAVTKSFLIPHPLYPDRMLQHACPEGPEHGVYDRGEDVIGDDGTVTIALPEYFEALTRKDHRTVQLTPVYEGRPVSVIAATPPIDGVFMVVGDPGQRFYWRIEAVRADVDLLDLYPPVPDSGLWNDADDVDELEHVG